jgi:hypothetical protein
MIKDSVLQEVRSAREAYAREHGYDVWAMVADLRASDDVGDWPVVRLASRRSDVLDASKSKEDPKNPEVAGTFAADMGSS